MGKTASQQVAKSAA